MAQKKKTDAGKSGWIKIAKKIISPNFNHRPANEEISLIVIHSISLPPAKYSGKIAGRAVEKLVPDFFQNKLNTKAHPYFKNLEKIEVSAHFYITRGGEIIQFVNCNNRAWHAGKSEYKGRENCNDYSIGIELQGLENQTFTLKQYKKLAILIKQIKKQYPAIKNIAGHENIAPERKQDPGKEFNWALLYKLLS